VEVAKISPARQSRSIDPAVHWAGRHPVFLRETTWAWQRVCFLIGGIRLEDSYSLSATSSACTSIITAQPAASDRCFARRYRIAPRGSIAATHLRPGSRHVTENGKNRRKGFETSLWTTVVVCVCRRVCPFLCGVRLPRRVGEAFLDASWSFGLSLYILFWEESAPHYSRPLGGRYVRGGDFTRKDGVICLASCFLGQRWKTCVFVCALIGCRCLLLAAAWVLLAVPGFCCGLPICFLSPKIVASEWCFPPRVAPVATWVCHAP